MALRKPTDLDPLPPIIAASVVTSVAMYPVDVIRGITMANPGTSAVQAYRGFIGAHGYSGFLKQGMAAEVTLRSISRTVKFFMQPICHRVLFGKPEKQGTPLSKGLSGAAGTFPEVFAISMFENFKLAEQLDKEKKFKSLPAVAQHLAKTRGVFGGFYIGYFGMQIRQCLWTGGFFLTLDPCKGIVKGNLGITGAPGDAIAGFFAGAFGVAINCWTDVSRSVLQKKAVADTFNPEIPKPSALGNFNPLPFFRQAGEIYGAKGIMGLYSGVGPKMVHLGGGGAIISALLPPLTKMWYDKQGIERV